MKKPDYISQEEWNKRLDIARSGVFIPPTSKNEEKKKTKKALSKIEIEFKIWKAVYKECPFEVIMMFLIPMTIIFYLLAISYCGY